MPILDTRASSLPPAPELELLEKLQDRLATLGGTWDPDRKELSAPADKYFLHPDCREEDGHGNRTGRRWGAVRMCGDDFLNTETLITTISEIVAAGFTEDDDDPARQEKQD